MNISSLNPLEVARKYLCDRHRRRQDRTYREREEERQLTLENELREIELIHRRLELARANGLPESMLRSLQQRIVGSPMEGIELRQDRRAIESSFAEIRELEPGDGHRLT